MREIAANRRALLPHRTVVRGLGRTVKDPWKTGPVEIGRPALVAELGTTSTVSIRLEPALAVIGNPKGKLRREAPDTLLFRRGRDETGRVTGDVSRLDLLAEILNARPADDIGSVLLPKDLTAFEHLAADRARAVQELLAAGREMVERVERLVCALYCVPDDLAEAVIEHAASRADSGASSTTTTSNPLA